MKRTTTTTTLLPFRPRPETPSPSMFYPQRGPSHSKAPSLDTSLSYTMPSSGPNHYLNLPRARSRTTPSIISEASCASSSSSSSSGVSPTYTSTPPSSLPPSPSPSNLSFGKLRPLPHPPKQQPPNIPSPTRQRPPPRSSALPASPTRPITPPPAWSPRQTPASRPTPPQLLMPPTPPQRQSMTTPDARLTPRASALQPAPAVQSPEQSRVRPLPSRPPPPGPPSEGNTPVALFGRPRWHTDPGSIPEDEPSPSPGDDRRAIDWDLIDEVMKHAS
ncbi:hypothetical protein BC834DRAFT_496227 [Gloeopeniophorella convolvens]|nr:hypothetical protein BC834DRAFT_496227 [Gloeopeniophorella convolvens]